MCRMIRKLTIPMIVFCTACSDPETPRPSGPQLIDSGTYTGCFDGAGFFEMDFADLAERLPSEFVPLDGSLISDEYAGKGLLTLIFLACPLHNGETRRWAMVATPIEDPSITEVLRPVRWSWYELARFEGDAARAEVLSSHGLKTYAAELSNAPFSEGDVESTFDVSLSGEAIFSVRAALQNTADMEAQSHRLWHLADDGRLISTRWDFEEHHSWLGSFDDCVLNLDEFSEQLEGVRCSAIGVTEAIATIDFVEQVVLWN